MVCSLHSVTTGSRGRANVSLIMEDCDYAVGGAVAAARPVIGNILRTSGSKGECYDDWP